ncbi:DUF262 domain-containing protein [Pseudotabrizicola formosa]|uniref:DUF262 domain-containing protein n=1 Tax=Pseudotabrizicola formosa TaxID=2030009 RepID=UPI000CD08126|nr:DUF262 domain-containing protein [Pseudotabrizicola formosa]
MIVTTATNKKVRELLKSVRDGSLIPRPEFQRRLVWTIKDKDKFIESVLKGYPFPEIYICNGEIDTDTGEGTQLLVDGLQRVSTLAEYFNGSSSFVHTLTNPYQDLMIPEKEAFLDYNVVVRDLGTLTKDQVIEVFRRLNSTQYTLRDMEVNNAIYDGAMKKFCERLSEHEFFEVHRVFLASDRKRMGDVSFCLSLVATMMYGYFNRDSEHESILSKYNESFPDESEYLRRIEFVFEFIDECGFDAKSRIWKKADFFTAFLELDGALNIAHLKVDPSSAVSNLTTFYDQVDSVVEQTEVAAIYYKSALQASNDRNNRLRRAFAISGVIRGETEDKVLAVMRDFGLV